MKHTFIVLALCLLVPSSVRSAEDALPDIGRTEKINLPFKKVYPEYGISGNHRDFQFTGYRGRIITMSLTDGTEKGSTFNLSLYGITADGADPIVERLFKKTVNGSFSYEFPRNGDFIIRLEEEELRGGKAILMISSEPILRFPIENRKNTLLVSLFGDGRDEGARFHEGIDIRAPRSTPVVAVADGTIRKVGRTEKGGNVISLWDPERKLVYYYAHLETQDIVQGKTVKAGDRLGTVGNSGNASGTFPHLHFTVYLENWKAIDPLYFVYDRNETLP